MRAIDMDEKSNISEAGYESVHSLPQSSSQLRLGDGSTHDSPGRGSTKSGKTVIDRKESTQAEIIEQPANNVVLRETCSGMLTGPGHFPTSVPTPLAMATLRPAHGSQHHQAPSLSSLPPDLHYILATHYLDFDTVLALRQTCRQMHFILTPDIVLRVRSRLIKRSLEVEEQQFRIYRTIYPRQRLGHLWDLLYTTFDFRLTERPAKELRCYGCLEVKPLWCFVERMSNRGMGLGAKCAQDRMCKDCLRRYRDVEGRWYKENWVKKCDMVRKISRGRRIRQWALEGQSLVNPEEEIGVCAKCGTGMFDLWWGCVACFEREEKYRQDQDLPELNGLQRTIANLVSAWRMRGEVKERRRQSSGCRRSRKWGFAPGITWKSGFSDRKAALVEWKESKRQGHHHRHVYGDHGIQTARQGSHWRAIDQIPLPKSRREARCLSCWVPKCPRRTYLLGCPLGMACEGPLPRERWCAECQQDLEARHAKKYERKLWKASSDANADGVFGDGWLDGLELGSLFDEQGAAGLA